MSVPEVWSMRKPSADPYAWHRAALAGRKPITTHDPEPGWFLRKLVKNGPLVPAKIWLHQPVDQETGELIGDEILRCTVGTRERNPDDEWTYLCGRPISESDYNFRIADAKWCREYEPSAPEANPFTPIKLRDLPPLF